MHDPDLERLLKDVAAGRLVPSPARADQLERYQRLRATRTTRPEPKNQFVSTYDISTEQIASIDAVLDELDFGDH